MRISNSLVQRLEPESQPDTKESDVTLLKMHSYTNAGGSRLSPREPAAVHTLYCLWLKGEDVAETTHSASSCLSSTPPPPTSLSSISPGTNSQDTDMKAIGTRSFVTLPLQRDFHQHISQTEKTIILKFKLVMSSVEMLYRPPAKEPR